MCSGRVFCTAICIGFTAALIGSVFAGGEETFQRLFTEKKYLKAVDFANDSIASVDRTPALWIKIGEAYDHLDMPEKALASFLVSWRMNQSDYQALLGAARAYNRLGNPEMALEMANKALEVQFTAEASWECARACISLHRPADAKRALARVIQTDSSNVIAVRELSNIYFHEGEWAAAVPLLKLTYHRNSSGELAFQIGKAYAELGVPDSALSYLLKSRQNGVAPDTVAILIGRTYFQMKKWGECTSAYDSAPKSNMSAIDWYRCAFATDKTRGSGAAAGLFEDALQRFGTTTNVPEALLTRERVAVVKIEKKKYRDAVQLLSAIVAADPKGAVVARAYTLLAGAYIGLNDLEDATGTLEKAIETNSRNVEAYALLADCYQKKGMPERSQEIYKTLLDLAPDDPAIYRALGMYQLANKRFTEALILFDKSNSLKKNAAALEGAALAAFGMNDTVRALESAQSALHIDATLRDARMVMARIAMVRQQFDAARGHFEKLHERDPDNRELLSALALCYQELKQTELLVTVNTRIAQLDPSDTSSRQQLASHYTSIKKNEEALRLYLQLAQRAPSSAPILRMVALLSKQTGALQEAVAWMRRYLSLVATDAEAHRDLGDLLYELNDRDEALLSYRTALKNDPGIRGFYKRYADIVVARGEQDEVISALKGVINSGNAEVSTYLTLGLVYQKKKEYIDAIEMYQTALKKEPANYEALTALAACQDSNGDLRDAIVSYEQAIMMNSRAVTELRDLGNIYMREKKVDEAVGMYLKFMEHDSSDVEVARRVGRYYYSKENFNSAVTYYHYAERDLDTDDALRYATACVRTGNNHRAIISLLPLKADRSVQGEQQQAAYLMLAKAYENDSDFTAASAAYGEYIGLRGVDDREAAFKQAALLEKNDPGAAQKIYELNCKKYPSDYRNFLQLALLYCSRQDMLTNAIPLLQRVAKLADSVPVVWLELGKIYGKTGRYDEELDAYRKYVAFDPQSIEANRRIGTLLIRRGADNEGVVFLEIANTQQPNDPEIMTLLAGGYVRMGRFAEAISLLTRAKAAKKDDPDIRFQLFELFQKNGQKDKALKEIEELIAVNREPRYLQLYVEALIIQGKLKDAEAAIEELIIADPENLNTLFLHAKLLRSRKLYDEAVEIYKDINQADPADARPLFERAETHREQDKPQWAETFYKRALRADPSMARAELGLAILAKARKDTVLYREYLDRAQLLAPDDELILEELKRERRK